MKKKRNKPLLTICVPTYNRPLEFERLLRGLLPQMNNRTELIVRDDSENQQTKAVFDNLVVGGEFSHRYYHGPKIGLDEASMFLLEKASGSFVWWFSDDDVFVEGAIKKAINIIEKNEKLNFIWVNFGFQNLNQLAVDRQDGLFQDRNEVLRSLGTNFGLISTYIVRKSVAVTGLDYAKKHKFGMAFAAAAIAFWVISKPGNSYFMRGPYILNNPASLEATKQNQLKPDGSIKNEAFDVYGVVFYNILSGLAHNFQRSAVRKMLKDNYAALWRGMLVAWIGGWDSPKGKRVKMMKLYWSFPEFWVAFPLFLMPRPVNAALYRVYKVFFSHRQFVFFGKLKKFDSKVGPQQ